MLKRNCHVHQSLISLNPQKDFLTHQAESQVEASSQLASTCDSVWPELYMSLSAQYIGFNSTGLYRSLNFRFPSMQIPNFHRCKYYIQCPFDKFQGFIDEKALN